MQTSTFEINIDVYEFSFVLKKTLCNLSKINTIVVNINNIETIDEIFVFEFNKWFASIKTLFEIIVVYEFSFDLKQMSCDISKINIFTKNNSDIESIDEILVFEFRKWIIVVAKKINFDFIVTFHIKSKNSFVFDIDKIIETMKISNKTCVKKIVNMKILNEKFFILIVIYEIFAKNSIVFDIEISNNSIVQRIVNIKISKNFFFEFIRLFDQESKNSFASYFENIEISIVVNFSSLKYFINENDFAIETFDFDIELNVYSKNSSI